MITKILMIFSVRTGFLPLIHNTDSKTYFFYMSSKGKGFYHYVYKGTYHFMVEVNNRFALIFGNIPFLVALLRMKFVKQLHTAWKAL